MEAPRYFLPFGDLKSQKTWSIRQVQVEMSRALGLGFKGCTPTRQALLKNARALLVLKGNGSLDPHTLLLQVVKELEAG